MDNDGICAKACVSHMEKIFYTMYAVNPETTYYLQKDVSRQQAVI